MSSRFVRYCEPKPCDAERSRRRRTVRSRSSTYFLTCGTPVRAVTFQSIVLTSSPGTYSRTSENSIPRPRKTEWYSPPTPASTRRGIHRHHQRHAHCSGRLHAHRQRDQRTWKQLPTAECNGERTDASLNREHVAFADRTDRNGLFTDTDGRSEEHT